MNERLFQRSDALLEHRTARAESYGRDWAGIGVGLAGAFALVAIFVAAIWALVFLLTA